MQNFKKKQRPPTQPIFHVESSKEIILLKRKKASYRLLTGYQFYSI